MDTYQQGLALGYFVGLVVDGCESDAEDAPFAGDGQFPPFAVFDAGRQLNLYGFYDTREEAQAALRHIELQEKD